MASGRRSSRDWLPPARSTLLMPNSRIGPFVEAKMDRHWFLCFANSIYEDQNDHSQGGMVAKVYAFLHDFMPQGFTGKWSHIKGNDVMETLLCHTKDFSVTRHKATQGAAAAFESIEDWTKKGANWKEAAKQAGLDSNKRNKSDGSGGAKKKGAKKASPILYSPTGLVVLLILSYPDPKYREWIGRLGIDWMMTRQPDKPLSVNKGFWEGITDENLLMFQPEEPRYSEVPLLADYDRLFGEDFYAACKDIRPFLPSWTGELSLTGQLSDTDHLPEEINSPLSELDESIASGEIHTNTSNNHQAVLGALLRFDTLPATDMLRGWLSEQLDGEDEVLRFWCDSWSDKIGQASHYEEQLIIQSLFQQSLSRLHALATSPLEYDASAQSYMLLDVEDGRSPEPGCSTDDDTVCRMRAIPLYKPRYEAEDKLIKLLPEKDQSSARLAFAEQIHFFVNLFKDQRFSKHVKNAIKFDTLRTDALLQAAATRGDKSAESTDTDQVICLTSELKLTKWQIRLLAVRQRDILEVLTSWQHHVYRRRSGDGTQDFTQYQPVDAVDRDDDDSTDSATKEMFRKLFGDLSAPFEALDGREINSITVARPGPHTDESVSIAAAGAPPSHSTPGLDGQLHEAAATALSTGHTVVDATLISPTPIPSARSAERASALSVSSAEINTPPRPITSGMANGTSSSNTSIKAPGASGRSVSGITTGASSVSGPKIPSTPATTTRVNPYAGRSSKRACSPDQRQVKAPRLSVTESQAAGVEESNEIIAHGSKAYKELQAGLGNLQQRIVRFTDERVRLSSVDIKKRMTSEREQLEDHIQSAADTQTARLETALDTINTTLEANATVKSITDALQAKFDAIVGIIGFKVQTAMETLKKQLDEQQDQRLDTKLQAITSALESLNRTQTPLPGQDGFLSANCTAPAEWDRDQEAYDAELLRAGWYYVSCLGHGDDGFEPDGDAFTSTMARFPCIDSKHLEIALQHVHIQAHRRPFQAE